MVELKDGVSFEETAAAAKAALEDVVSYIDRNMINNESLNDNQRIFGENVNDQLSKVLFDLT